MKQRAFGILFALHLFVLPIPGTIALRNALMLACLVLVAMLWRECRFAEALRALPVRRLGTWLALISAWLLIQAALISDETRWAIQEVFIQWLPALLAALLGLAAVVVGMASGVPRNRLFAGLALIFLAQTAFCLLATLPDFLRNGVFPDGRTAFTAGRLEISFWNNLLLPFLVADLVQRWLHRQALIDLPAALIGGGVVLLSISNLAFAARAGIVLSLAMLTMMAILILWRERARLGGGRALALIGAAGGLMLTLAGASLESDERWAGFRETARLAWQNEDETLWLKGDSEQLPSLPSGAAIDSSAFFRISWIRGGLDLVESYPLGVGYGRNAFGHALRKTTETRLGHAHSGLVDWTIGTGLPGLALWTGFLGWLAGLGGRRYFSGRDAAGLVLLCLVAGFFGRMGVDSINRDHMLMLFFMLLAMLVALPDDPVPS